VQTMQFGRLSPGFEQQKKEKRSRVLLVARL
jgi:hypothetical protein